jgi:hypothetical protein
VLQSAVKENAMHYSVQFFTWTPKQGVHQVGSTIEIDAVNPKLAAVSLLGLRWTRPVQPRSSQCASGIHRMTARLIAPASIIIKTSSLSARRQVDAHCA